MANPASKSVINHQYTLTLVQRHCRLWGIEDVADKVQVEFSKRIKRSLGRTQPSAKYIRLNPQLQTGSKDLLEEVLCHELAHIAAHHIYGDSIRPHGPEWQSLVCVAGYEPSIRLAAKLRATSTRHTKYYTHYCPVCHTKRTASKPMNRWRCGECVANCLSGILEIKEER